MSVWQYTAALVAVLAPMVGVPVGVFTFYLKGLRDQQRSGLAELSSRLAILEAAVQRMRDEIGELRRDYTTKEEWLREGLRARGQIEHLMTAVTRVQVELEQGVRTPADARRTAGGGEER